MRPRKKLMKTTAPRFMAVLALGIALLATGCSSGSQPSPAVPTPASASPTQSTAPISEKPSAAPTAASKTSRAPTAMASPCKAEGLPEGIDSRVCRSSVGNAKKLTADEYGSAWVITASGNIWCDFMSAEVSCAMMEPYTRLSLKASGPAKKADYDDGPPGSEPVTLRYGQPVIFNGAACLAQEIGVSCWNLASGHGMFLSRAKTVTW